MSLKHKDMTTSIVSVASQDSSEDYNDDKYNSLRGVPGEVKRAGEKKYRRTTCSGCYVYHESRHLKVIEFVKQTDRRNHIFSRQAPNGLGHQRTARTGSLHEDPPKILRLSLELYANMKENQETVSLVG
ncbi:hypothetical protein EVAR_32580_1 [Eumeta japonica]|uniref:Uncharacterized protein n=1 Tax=Eumeta variegata TaxID=151549 RepID=A0A4C1VRX9_EUMVA|nr:hypothetical protein EVAR_32580_1 [Eumeta japonica]